MYNLKVLNRKETVPREPCFEDEEYELIKQSCEWQILKRISLSELKNRLKELIENSGILFFFSVEFYFIILILDLPT